MTIIQWSTDLPGVTHKASRSFCRGLVYRHQGDFGNYPWPWCCVNLSERVFGGSAPSGEWTLAWREGKTGGVLNWQRSHGATWCTQIASPFLRWSLAAVQRRQPASGSSADLGGSAPGWGDLHWVHQSWQVGNKSIQRLAHRIFGNPFHLEGAVRPSHGCSQNDHIGNAILKVTFWFQPYKGFVKQSLLFLFVVFFCSGDCWFGIFSMN